MQSNKVETACGTVEGHRHPAGAWAFLGIPYGQTTTGENRFRPARPARPWRGVLQASAWGAHCPQGGFNEHPDYTQPLPGPVPTSSEDCLKLNLWSPAGHRAGKRPVMVWLHGGGFSVGSAAQAITNGGNLAAFGDAVVISLNHRLNIFGFLFLDDVSGGAVSQTANLGLTDIVLALRWVRDNVAAFGGDPDNVTLFGVSGGGRKICNLMAMPSAKGLFHKAIIESGPHLRCIPRDRASRFAAGFLHHLGVAPRDIRALHRIPASRLQALSVAYCRALNDPAVAEDPTIAIWMMSPVVDGAVLPEHPWDGQAPEASRNVPLLIGTNKDEAAVHLCRRPGAGQMTIEALQAHCERALGPRAEAILNAHARARPEETPWELLVGIASEDRRLMAADIALQKTAQGGAPAYLYLFTWETDFRLYKAAHGIEVPFVFRTVDQSPMTGGRADRHILAETVSAAWITFARTGHPQVPGIAHWPIYEPARRTTMILDVPPRLASDPRRAERLAFGGTGACMPWEPRSLAVGLTAPFAVRTPA
ncbi:carboxylesterase/lipase family protein [Antarctobacter sp.]|uniref:carboxylesterase/lipase family protein n=1 Tax=Antarctobacter sp. TaxID=1872577 RepID=UPI003A93DDF5